MDASNHIIMDYSIHDDMEAGFDHVVSIIRKDIEKNSKKLSVIVLHQFVKIMV